MTSPPRSSLPPPPCTAATPLPRRSLLPTLNPPPPNPSLPTPITGHTTIPSLVPPAVRFLGCDEELSVPPPITVDPFCNDTPNMDGFYEWLKMVDCLPIVLIRLVLFGLSLLVGYICLPIVLIRLVLFGLSRLVGYIATRLALEGWKDRWRCRLMWVTRMCDRCILFSFGMQETIEGYRRHARDTQTRLRSAEQYVQYLKQEAASMMKKIDQLEASKRKLMGEGLGSCSIDELRQLEQQLERSLSSVLARKTQVYTEQIDQLKEMEKALVAENSRLSEKCEVRAQAGTNDERENKA